MGMGFAPNWLRQVSPLLHKTTLTTGKKLGVGFVYGESLTEALHVL